MTAEKTPAAPPCNPPSFPPFSPSGETVRLPRLSRLAALLYPFAAGAVAINLFLLGLMAQWIGLPALSPGRALALGLPLGLPAAFGFALWVRGLLTRSGGL